MTIEDLTRLADATADALGRRVGRSAGYVLILVDLAPGGEIVYRSDLDRLDAAGVLDDCAEHLRATADCETA